MWRQLQCQRGHTHTVWAQEKIMSCGIACMMMAIHRTGKVRTAKQRLLDKMPALKTPALGQGKVSPGITEGDLRLASQRHRFGYRPDPKDVGAKSIYPHNKNKAGMLMDELSNLLIGSKQHIGVGGLSPLAATLNWLGVPAVYRTLPNTQSVIQTLKKARLGSPIIAGVEWPGGFHHAVLADFAKDKGKGNWEVCFCDPDGSVECVQIPSKLTTLALYPHKGVFCTEIVMVG